jgi:hypothetical protein
VLALTPGAAPREVVAIEPPDPAATHWSSYVKITPDGAHHAFTAFTVLSELHLVTGLAPAR